MSPIGSRVAIGAIGIFFTALAAAQSWPARPVRLVVPFAAGATTDVTGRIIAGRLAETLGQPVVVENRTGGGGAVGAELVAKAAPDGYTILLGEPGGMAINPVLNKSTPYHPVRDFAPIGQAVSVPMLLIAHPSLPARNLAELRALPKDRALPYGTPGNGTMQHLTTELLRMQLGLNLQHVPYRGGAPAMNDLISGTIPLLMITVPTAIPQLKAGKAVPIALLSASRSALLPEVGTVAEGGLPGFAVAIWQGFFAPAGTPREIVARLGDELRKALATPDVRERLIAAGNDVVPSTPEEFGRLVRDEYERWGKVAREANIKAE